jgi:hypothetical protein
MLNTSQLTALQSLREFIAMLKPSSVPSMNAPTTIAIIKIIDTMLNILDLVILSLHELFFPKLWLIQHPKYQTEHYGYQYPQHC